MLKIFMKKVSSANNMRESKSLKDLNYTKASTEYGNDIDGMIFIKILKDAIQTKNAKY